MSYLPALSQAFSVWPIFLVLVGLIGLLKTPWLKGLLGEALVRCIAWLRLPPDAYHRIHNITLPARDGTTQIDHVIVSRFGVFVVETKNMKGRIFGGADQGQWTQKTRRKAVKFQSPLRQNHKHVKAVEAALDIPPEAIHSVVAFVGTATFKTPMPVNVTTGAGYVRYIRSFSRPVLDASEVQAVMDQIQSGRLAPGR